MKRITFILSAAGIVFTSYLIVIGLLSDECAFESPCYHFLGIPAYWYGFALFFLVALMLMLFRWNIIQAKTEEITVLVASGIGMIFSGIFAAQVSSSLSNLSGPLLGMIFFTGIFGITLYSFLKYQNNK